MKERVVPALLIALGLAAAGFFAGGRYTMVRGEGSIVTRMDRLTGAMWMCGVVYEEGSGLLCVRMDENKASVSNPKTT